MLMREFQKNVSANLREVVDSGEPIPVTNYRRPWVHVVPSDKWLEASEALALKEDLQRRLADVEERERRLDEKAA